MKYTNRKKLNILSHTFLSESDIQVLLDYSAPTAHKIHQDYVWELRKRGVQFNPRKIPTALFIKDFGIKEARIKKYADYEEKGLVDPPTQRKSRRARSAQETKPNEV